MTEDEVTKQKDIQHYAASVTAWFNTSIELDKSLFTLSVGGLGLLVTLVTTLGVANETLLVLYIVAILAFLASLVTLLAIFYRNKLHIQRVVQGNLARDSVLGVLDIIAVTTFGAGALVTAIVGIATAVNAHNSKERGMATENKRTQVESTDRRSFNGAGALKPQTVPVPAPAETQPTTQTPAPAQPSEKSDK